MKRSGGEGGGVELNYQLLGPEEPTLASQDKLKVSPEGLPFVTYSKATTTSKKQLFRLIGTSYNLW